jgi:hypothetical protein
MEGDGGGGSGVGGGSDDMHHHGSSEEWLCDDGMDMMMSQPNCQISYRTESSSHGHSASWLEVRRVGKRGRRAGGGKEEGRSSRI